METNKRIEMETVAFSLLVALSSLVAYLFGVYRGKKIEDKIRSEVTKQIGNQMISEHAYYFSSWPMVRNTIWLMGKGLRENGYYRISDVRDKVLDADKQLLNN